MSALVMKFGGTSLADETRLRRAARHAAREAKNHKRLAVIVSAQGGETDSLLNRAKIMSGAIDSSETDAVLAAGEQISAALFALALQEIGVKARSWQSWQIPIRAAGSHGSARLASIKTEALTRALNQGETAVICGFQAVTADERIATLGRGGSDTSAVALAAALQAKRCDIYTDVDGVFTADPRIVKKAHRLGRIAYEEMLEMASLGARVLETRAVALAMMENVALWVRSAFDDWTLSPKPGERGTWIGGEEEIVEKEKIRGISCAEKEAKITLTRLQDKPGVAAAVFAPLAKAGVIVDMIAQSAAAGKAAAGAGAIGATDLTFTVARQDLARAKRCLEEARAQIGYEGLFCEESAAKLSVVGIAMRSQAGVASVMFRALAEAKINIHAISTSEIKISILIESRHAKKALRILHQLYGLDG